MEKAVSNPFQVLSAIAAGMRQRQAIHPGDRTDEQGQIICGRCGQYRRKYRLFADPAPEDPARMTPILITLRCACDDEAERAEEEARKRMEDQKLMQGLRKASLIDKRFAQARLCTFSRNQDNARLYAICERYVLHFDRMLETNQGLLLWGDVGSGKTYAAATIANELLDRRVPVVMTSFVRILQILQGNREEALEIINRLNRAKLVIFDDLGAERSTDYALEQVYNIVDARYRAGLPMILTTNRALKDITAETDMRYTRIYDRLLETCYPYRVTGLSWRKRSAAQKMARMEGVLFGS